MNAESSISLAGPPAGTTLPSLSSAGQSPTLRIQRSKGWAAINFRELWAYRDLLWLLIERDIKVIYKQTALGALWIVLQPLIAAPIFTLIFGRIAKLPSDGAPYALFVFCGLTIWTYFSQALLRAGNSLVSNSQLVSKVYFPRLLIPLGHTVAALVDFVVVLIVLFVLMAVYRVPPSFRLFLIPILLLLMTLTATGVALWFSALGVKYRDVRYALPYLVQVWMYASPVLYPISMVLNKVPAQWQPLLAINPAVGFIEGFRWMILGRGALNLNIVLMTILMSLLTFFSGALFFRRAERKFADII